MVARMYGVPDEDALEKVKEEKRKEEEELRELKEQQVRACTYMYTYLCTYV